MYLKKLTLHGFKSFADSTSLEFGPGITAIVGPNGSGKSNLVDALLWALGERSHKAVRGHNASDVIFNGAAGRKPVSLAEVSLVMDNQDRLLPLEFGEVQVNRRVYRDGEGEYSINKTGCRLRDIQDLFLDTGMGTSAANIISQGDIDAILSARPEERRGLIEGAAGVQKYHARRTETRRKLDKVEADLTRVRDIMAELESQLGPLAAQAELAREYDNYLARLRLLQLAILAREYEVRSRRLQGLTESSEDLGRRVAEGQQQVVQLETREAALEHQLREMEDIIDRLHSELTRLVTEVNTTEGQIALSRERRRALSEQQEFQAQEIGLLRARIGSLQATEEQTREQLAATNHEASSLATGAAGAEARLGAAASALSDATRALQNLQTQVISLMKESQARREEMAHRRARTESLQHRLQELQQLAGSIQEEADAVATVSQTLRDQFTAATQQQEAAAAALAAARQELQQARQGEADAVTRVQQHQIQRGSLMSRHKALHELQENLEGIQGGARAVLQAARQGKLTDQYEVVAGAIRAPRELEVAIEVALGSSVHHLICASQDAAQRGIEYLKSTRTGRATFLPLPALRPTLAGDKTRKLLGQPGVRGVASELVQATPEHQPAVDYLLGRVLIVETLEQARSLAGNCEFSIRLVTLEGDVVLPAGAMTGGQGKHQPGGLLARGRELEELSRAIATLETELSDGEAALKSARGEVGRMQQVVQTADDQLRQAETGVARLEREREHHDREARRLAQTLQTVQQEVQAHQANLAGQAEAEAAGQEEAARWEAQAQALDGQVAEAQALVDFRQTEREQVASDVAEVRGNFLAVQERLHAQHRQVDELNGQIEELEAQIVVKQAGIERAGHEDQQLVVSEARLVSLLSELQQRHREMEGQNAGARAGRRQALQELDTIEQQLRDGRQKVHENEEELHRAEVKIAATTTELQDMVRRFTEEFQLTVEDALPCRERIEQKQLALDEMEVLRDKLEGLGPVNPGAIAQHQQVSERLEFLGTQRQDLEESGRQLEAIIGDIDQRTEQRFRETFQAVQQAFQDVFQRVFDGGTARLNLTLPDNLLETGIEMAVQLPGKVVQDIGLLSGGERALTALSFLLALLRVRPAPFVVLDEVDAPLDQSNVGRFNQLLREFTSQTQFIVITHNNGTMQASDVLYGVTMQKQGISTLMAVRLVDHIDEGVPVAANGHANGHANGNGS